MCLSRKPKPQPLFPIREWVGAEDGEEWLAIHPFYLAMLRHYAPPT
jgi:hypothetical protein